MSAKFSVFKSLNNILRSQMKLLEKGRITQEDVDGLFDVWTKEHEKFRKAVAAGRGFQVPELAEGAAAAGRGFQVPELAEGAAAAGRGFQVPELTEGAAAAGRGFQVPELAEGALAAGRGFQVPELAEGAAHSAGGPPPSAAAPSAPSSLVAKRRGGGGGDGHLKSLHSSAVSTTLDENGMKMTVDLKDYKPEEVSVRVEGQWLIIEAIKDGWSEEHKGLIHRHVMRRYELVENADVSKISSSMKNGQLIVTVPLVNKMIKGGDEEKK